MGNIIFFLAAIPCLLGNISTKDLFDCRNRYRIPGVALALIQDGNIEIQCVGYADKAAQQKIIPQSIFQAASLSKVVTAWAILQLAGQGKIDMDEPIEKYLTRWRFPPSPYSSLQVTTRRILNHTGGFRFPAIAGTCILIFYPL